MELRVRRPNVDDIPEIEDIAKKKQWPLVQTWERAAVIEKKTEADKEIGTSGNLTAFGVLRGNCEAVLYLDKDIPLKEKITSLDVLMRAAVSDAKELKQDEIYVFAEDEEFARILMKHFKFRRAKGVPLIMDLNYGE